MRAIPALALVLCLAALPGCELLATLQALQNVDVGCPDTGEASRGTMTARVDGEDYEACVVSGSTANGADDDKVLVVSGIAYDVAEPVTLQVTVTATGPGVWPLGSGDNHGLYMHATETPYDTNDEDDTDSGEVDITSMDEDGWAGTFWFTATEDEGDATIEITDGVFEVSFSAE